MYEEVLEEQEGMVIASARQQARSCHRNTACLRYSLAPCLGRMSEPYGACMPDK